jgi:hypothetical protein
MNTENTSHQSHPRFFMKMNNEQKLCIATYIINATLLVGGTTIHSLLGLSIDKHALVNKSNSIVDIWPTIGFINIDAISMINYNLFVSM